MHDTTLPPSVPAASGGWSSRWHALDFALRAEGLRWLRRGRDALAGWRGVVFAGARQAGDWPSSILSDSVTRLWTQRDAGEWRLTAGKVQNLRAAAARLNGLVVQPDEIFSFWHAVGAPTRRRGFVAGRELREGCLVASTGGGLCQLSNALYAAALDAGAQIVERHPHSRTMPGSQAEAHRDATVFWNYLDLRFRLPQRFVIEVRLDSERLTVRLRGTAPMRLVRPPLPIAAARDDAHDCIGCAETRCVQRIAAQPRTGRTAVMPTSGWPEFDAWLQQRHLPHQAMPSQAWQAAWHRLAARACRHRPARRQHHLLALDDTRTAAWAARLSHDVDELVVPVEALAELQRRGALGGRRVTVLMTRSPLRMLHGQLDAAQANDPSPGLREYRAAPARVEAEWAALQDAVCLLTPHHAVACYLRENGRAAVELLHWTLPPALALASKEERGSTLLFPASTLARKGATELRDACRALEKPLAVLGRASDVPDFWHGLERVPLDEHDPWHGVGCVVLPAWVEHAPRCLLQALARGLPVIATPACGLDPQTPGLRLVPPGDSMALALALYEDSPGTIAA